MWQQTLGTSTDVLLEEAGLTLGGHSSLKAALDRNWGEPIVRSRGAVPVREEVDRWKRWLEQPQSLPEPQSPLREVLEMLVQMVQHDTEPDPEGGPGGRRLKKPVAPERRIAIEAKDRRHGRKSSAKTFNGFTEHFVLELDSRVTREVVVRPAHEPE